MLGTKLLLLSLVVYVSAQDVSYYGGSNVRTQGRLPPRPLGPYRPPYQPTAEPMRPVYYPPTPEQPAPIPQPIQPRQPVYPPPHSVYQPPAPETPRPEYETSPKPIYPPFSPPASMPVQPRPIDNHPRPLPPRTWNPVPSTEAPAQAIPEETPEAPDNTVVVYPESPSSPPGNSLRTEDPEVPLESTPEPTPAPEEPLIVSQPNAEDPSPSIPDDPLPDSGYNPQPGQGPPPGPLPGSRPEEPLSDPEPLIPIDIPGSEPVTYPNVRPLPPRPLPTWSPVTSKPQPITPEPIIPDLPVSEPNYVPIQPVEPEDSEPASPERPILPPIQPVVPARPNYRPIPTAPAPQSPSWPPLEPTGPNYRPWLPPAPVNTEVPNFQRPLPPQPPAPTYEPLRPPTPYPTPATSPAPVPTQSPALPTSYPLVPTSIGPAPGLPDISLVIPMHDFQCSNGNGYYKIQNECDTYIECQSLRAFKHSCPDGLHFNPEALYPEYPCAYPSEVQCDSTASKQIPRPTNECPNRYGFFPISGGDCSKYIMCQEGKATLMNCPFGLVFNDKLSSCDWPENVPHCNPNAFKDFTCPMPPEDDPDLLTRYRYGSDCGMYVACQRGHPRLLSCDAGLSFDVKSQVCIDADLVAECKITNHH